MSRLFFMLSLFIINIPTSGICQDFKADMEKIERAYIRNDRFSAEIQYSVFLDNNLVAPYQSGIGIFKKDRKRYYLKKFDTEVVCNNKVIVTVDHKNKLLLLYHAPAGLLNAHIDVKIDSLMKFYRETRFFKPHGSKTQHAYSIILKYGTYESVDIVFNSKSYLVEKIIYHYRDKMMENNALHAITYVVEYLKMDFPTTFDPLTFSERQFLDFSEGKYLVSKKYHDFKFYNNLSK